MWLGGRYVAPRDLHAAMDDATACCLDFVVVPLVHPRLKNIKAIPDDLNAHRSDRLLVAERWAHSVIGEVCRWIPAGLSSVSVKMRKEAESALRQRCRWATHVGLEFVVLPGWADSSDVFGYASIVASILEEQSGLTIMLECDANSWSEWDAFRETCDFHPRLKITLINLFSKTDFSESNPSDLYRHWIGEPVLMFDLPTSVFLSNANGFPSLIPAHQDILCLFLKNSIQAVLTGRFRHDDVVEGEKGFKPYALYVLHHVETIRNSMPSLDLSGFHDFLQDPLQPLRDHIDAGTYEVFEADNVKYDLYYEATLKALKDLSESVNDDVVQVCVVGPGRGPLVLNAFKAWETLGLSPEKMRLTTVEKNPNALVTLKSLRRARGLTDRWDLVEGDARTWGGLNNGLKIHLLISELLGSWGDNELAPECLVEVVADKMDEKHGICIPSSYSSYICPITDHNVWNACRDLARTDSDCIKVSPFETQWVCKLHRVFHLTEECAKVFEFSHNPGVREEMFEREIQLEFEFHTKRRVFGFSGTFEAVLYKDVVCSTARKSHSPEMTSWFELYVPVKRPASLERVDLNVKRRTNGSHVWYEWTMKGSPVHNVNGRSHKVGLQVA